MTVDARRYEGLASAIVGRPMRVAWGTGPSWTDGRTIELDPDQADRARDVVVVQAALLAGGALERDAVRSLRGRPSRIGAHLRTEVPRVLTDLAGVLPPRSWALRPAVVEPWWGTIKAGRLLADKALVASDAAPVSLVGDPTPPNPEDDSDQDGDEGRGAARRIANMGRTGRSRRRRRAEGTRRADGVLGSGRAVRSTSSTTVLRLASTDAGPVVVVDAPSRPGAVATYPEWDERDQRYRVDWCSVHEVPARPGPGGDSSEGAGLAQEWADRAVRRRLAAVHLDLAVRRRQPQGDELDLDAVIDHRVDVAATGGAGSAGPPPVHREARRRRRDLGVLVLIDTSGSTGSAGADGVSTLQRQLEGAVALLDALQALGDRVACATFNSHGRHRVEVTPLKGFEEAFDVTALTRLAAVRPGGFTRLGAAVRHGAHLLVERSGSRRWLLVVLSDGLPFDSGYEASYAAGDVRRAIGEVRRAGVGTLCLGLGTTVPDRELQAVFGASTYAVGPSIAELGADLATLVRSALGGADRSRRLAGPVS